MRALTFVFALMLPACAASTRGATPPEGAKAPRNTAVEYAHTIAAGAVCVPISTARANQPDTAICDFAQVLAYCRVGVGAGSQCAAFADLRPREAPPADVVAPASGEKPTEKPAEKSIDKPTAPAKKTGAESKKP